MNLGKAPSWFAVFVISGLVNLGFLLGTGDVTYLWQAALCAALAGGNRLMRGVA